VKTVPLGLDASTMAATLEVITIRRTLGACLSTLVKIPSVPLTAGPIKSVHPPCEYPVGLARSSLTLWVVGFKVERRGGMRDCIHTLDSVVKRALLPN
jgi:hypothetical protein